MLKNLTENVTIIALILANLVVAVIMSADQYMSGTDNVTVSIAITMAYPLVLALSAGLAHLIGHNKTPKYGAKIISTLLITSAILGALAIVAVLAFPEGIKAIVVPRAIGTALGNTVIAIVAQVVIRHYTKAQVSK